MKAAFLRNVRIYIAQAWHSYHGRFAITDPFGYITSKIGFPFFLMIFFVFMGKFVGYSDPLYIVIGNILLIPANNGMSGLTLAIDDERHFGTLSYILGSPAPRAPLFLGRAFFYILDGFVTALLGFILATVIFQIDMTAVDIVLLMVCVFLLAITSSGIGFLFGSISLLSRDGLTFLTTFISLLYILVGVNFPVEVLPQALQKVAYGLPLTRGVQAARLILQGTGWGEVRSLFLGETLVGAIYILVGYAIFRWVERRSLQSGLVDAR